MTLVVAKLDKNTKNIKIFSDTRITDDVKKENSKLFEGIIKSVIYTPEICISYAGSKVSSDEIHKSIFGTNYKLDVNELINLLLNFHHHRNCDIEFLISNIQYHALGFAKISGGKVEQSDTTSWIGDINAFSLFQKKFHELSKDKEIKKQLDFAEEAFEHVIVSTDISTVGGVSIIINRTKYGFQYVMKSKSILGRVFSGNSKDGKPVLLDLGSAMEGSFNISYLISKNPNTPALGIHYFDGNFGIFSNPNKSREFQLYKNVGAEEFIKIVEKEHHIKLGGAIVRRGGAGFV